MNYPPPNEQQWSCSGSLVHDKDGMAIHPQCEDCMRRMDDALNPLAHCAAPLGLVAGRDELCMWRIEC